MVLTTTGRTVLPPETENQVYRNIHTMMGDLGTARPGPARAPVHRLLDTLLAEVPANGAASNGRPASRN
jgi:hypothetical protein